MGGRACYRSELGDVAAGGEESDKKRGKCNQNLDRGALVCILGGEGGGRGIAGGCVMVVCLVRQAQQ